MAKTVQIVIDCADPAALAEFWADALGYVLEPPPAGHDSWPDWLTAVGVPEHLWNSRSAVIDPDGVGPRVFFQQVSEAKTVKNRVHLDVRTGVRPGSDEHREAVSGEVARLEGRGATIAWVVDTDIEHHTVMRDPEGNEFCVT